MKNKILQVMTALIVVFFISCVVSEHEKAYRKALYENTIESYEMFLQNYPDNKEYSELVRVKIDSLAFIRTLYENTIESYEMFLQNYPNSKKYCEIAFIKALKKFAAEKNGIPSAAIRATNNIQRIVIINENGDREKLVSVKDWRATTVENLVLIGIIRRDTVYAGSKLYTGGHSIEEYDIEVYLEIYEARTGKRLYNKHFRAEDVYFPDVTTVSDKTRTGRVDFDQITAYILSLNLGPIPRLPQPIFKREALRDPDGNVYTTVIIGSQEWTVENWRSTKYADGTPIPYVAKAGKIGGKSGWSNLRTAAYCRYDHGIFKNVLYNWYVVAPKNPKKIAPEGWRVPTDEDWNVLIDYLWDKPTEVFKIGESLAARGWQPRSLGKNKSIVSGDNNSGFTALPGGYRPRDGEFWAIGYDGYWWCATATEMVFSISAGQGKLDYSFWRSFDCYKECGYSVRLLRD